MAQKKTDLNDNQFYRVFKLRLYPTSAQATRRTAITMEPAATSLQPSEQHVVLVQTALITSRSRWVPTLRANSSLPAPSQASGAQFCSPCLDLPNFADFCGFLVAGVCRRW